MSKLEIRGSIPALVTPFTNTGAIDYSAFGKLIDWHMEQGSDALVFSGTTGESATITREEQAEVLRFGIKRVRGRVPVIAGTGANSTQEAIILAKDAKNYGADAHLSVVPYYNKPNQQGIFAHFEAIALAVDLPLILYNVPGRTVADMSTETAVRLAHLPRIIGLKDATGDIERGALTIRDVPAGFSVYSGDDGTAAALMLMGAQGTISVTANVAPALMHDLCAAALRGDVAETRKTNDRLADLHKAVFADTNPAPVKWALMRMGLIGGEMRLPLTPMQKEFRDLMERAMKKAGIDLTA